jgi:hypothetical protein
MRLPIIAALLCTASLAAADPVAKPAVPTTKNADATQMHSDDCARARAQNKTCVLDMTGTDIDGETPTAGGSAVSIVTWIKATSLVHIRQEFITEIIKSAEDL